MTQLSVNVNKLATLRNSRGKNIPNVLEYAQKILNWGAVGLTVHPRPDERHIRKTDVWDIHQLVADRKRQNPQIEFNVEGYPSAEFLDFMEQVRPDQCTLVPDPPEALTSNAGWELEKNMDFLSQTVARLAKVTRVSLFVEPARFTAREAESLRRIAPQRIELYTEAYADSFGRPDNGPILQRYMEVAQTAQKLGIGVNAGHDLNQKNMPLLLEKIPGLLEVSIGHALVCEALEEGMATTIRHYLSILSGR